MLFVTVISTMITVIGFLLQIFDAFPEHREARKTIVIMALGFTVGAGVTAALGATYNVTGNVDRQFALLYGVAGAAAVFALAGVLTGDDKRRSAAFTAASAFGVVFFAVGFAVSLGSMKSVEVITDSERSLLASSAEQSGDIDRAIEHLQSLAASADSMVIAKAYRDRIVVLRAKQASKIAQPR